MRDLCSGCERQPCTCATARDPLWLAKLVGLELDPMVRAVHAGAIAAAVVELDTR